MEFRYNDLANLYQLIEHNQIKHVPNKNYLIRHSRASYHISTYIIQKMRKDSKLALKPDTLVDKGHNNFTTPLANLCSTLHLGPPRFAIKILLKCNMCEVCWAKI